MSASGNTVGPAGAAVASRAMSTVGTPVLTETYRILSPNGTTITIPRELFRAFERFMGEGRRLTGRIEIDCKDGHVCGVRALEVFR